MQQQLDELRRIDEQIVAAAKGIKVLSRLTWSQQVQAQFLDGVRSGNLRLPAPVYQPVDLGENRVQLSACIQQLESMAHHAAPLVEYLHATATSYHTLCLLLEAIGTADLSRHSRALYGTPDEPVSSGDVTSKVAARHFLTVSEQYRQTTSLHEDDYCLSAEILADEMVPALAEVFGPDVVRVEVDPHMASKAAAGATRIRLRTGTCFSEYDLGQLLQHEGFVHSLTAINGARQPVIQSLSLGSPRTTAAQEGLATFAELVTGVMDISRLERLALRVMAIDLALSGADFIEVFRFFIDAGQCEMESFNSAMRIFRGVPVTGGAAFTKDVVYLHGLVEVHTFFRWAMQHQKLALSRYFFAGRMTVGDISRLAPCFANGTLIGPTYLPPWMTKTSGLAGYLAFSVFANQIGIDRLDEHHSFEPLNL